MGMIEQRLYCVFYAPAGEPKIVSVRAQIEGHTIILRDPSPYTGRRERLEQGSWEFNRYHADPAMAILAELRNGRAAQGNAQKAIKALREQAHALTVMLARAKSCRLPSAA